MFLPLFLCLCNCPDGLLIVVSYTGLTPLQTLGDCPKLANAWSDDQFKELALYMVKMP